MREITGDFWVLYQARKAGIFCIPTNGAVKSNGHAVMGRGLAEQALDRFPDIAGRLGEQLHTMGNRVQFIHERLLAFPTKPVDGVSTHDNVVSYLRKRFPPGRMVPGWALLADLDLIARSLRQLVYMHDRLGWDDVYLPRPGCGAGELDWHAQVKPLCEPFPDWLIVVSLDEMDI